MEEAIPKMFNQLTFLEGPFNYPRIDELSNDNIRVVGPKLVFGKIFNHIGFNKIPDELFKDLAISRITHPGSKFV